MARDDRDTDAGSWIGPTVTEAVIVIRRETQEDARQRNGEADDAPASADGGGSVDSASGWIARKLGQARVIGEIVGGILLGPSMLSRIAQRAFSLFCFQDGKLGSFEGF